MKRSEIRENIFRLVFCAEFHASEEIPEQVKTYLEEIPDLKQDDQEYIQNKFEEIKKRVPEIDSRINEVAKGWKTDRMGKSELAIIRLAVYEMLYDETVPVKVAINEAVDLARKYGGDESPAFVNGILAKLVS
ncbi:MAG: transcription antitermination factor NusB [Candidatus Choladocola sp.]|nr:transcription antitermination factor NusB [Candidatus Choladocola sp.]